MPNASADMSKTSSKDYVRSAAAKPVGPKSGTAPHHEMKSRLQSQESKSEAHESSDVRLTPVARTGSVPNTPVRPDIDIGETGKSGARSTLPAVQRSADHGVIAQYFATMSDS